MFEVWFGGYSRSGGEYSKICLPLLLLPTTQLLLPTLTHHNTTKLLIKSTQHISLPLHSSLHLIFSVFITLFQSFIPYCRRNDLALALTLTQPDLSLGRKNGMAGQFQAGPSSLLVTDIR